MSSGDGGLVCDRHVERTFADRTVLLLRGRRGSDTCWFMHDGSNKEKYQKTIVNLSAHIAKILSDLDADTRREANGNIA